MVTFSLIARTVHTTKLCWQWQKKTEKRRNIRNHVSWFTDKSDIHITFFQSLFFIRLLFPGLFLFSIRVITSQMYKIYWLFLGVVCQSVLSRLFRFYFFLFHSSLDLLNSGWFFDDSMSKSHKIPISFNPISATGSQPTNKMCTHFMW